MEWYAEQTKAMLDETNPIARGSSFKELDYREQFLAAFPDMWWCDDLQRTIAPVAHGLYEEYPKDSKLYQIIEEFNHARYDWALDYEPEDEDEAKTRQKFIEHIDKCTSTSAINRLIGHLKELRLISSGALNTKKSLLGTSLGAINLFDGRYFTDPDEYGFVDYDPEEVKACLITKSTTAILHPSIEDREILPEWTDFIDEITCHDHELAAFMQRAFGYGLLGGNPEEVMFILYGPTSRNGKGVLMSAIQAAMGDYAETLTPGFLGKRTNNDVTDAELAALNGVRMAFCNEPPKGMTFDDSKLKTLTGGDSVRCAAKFGPAFTYMPDYTIYLACNELPKINDEAIFLSNRILVIPFNRHFEPSEQNKDLKRYFCEDEDIQMSILQWLIDGYLEYEEQGLNPPAAVLNASTDYRVQSQNGLEQFLYEFAVRDSSGRWEYNDFKEWFKAWRKVNDFSVDVTTHELRKQLRKKGYEVKKSNGKQYLMGLVKKPDCVGSAELEALINAEKTDTDNSPDNPNLVTLSDDDDDWWE